MKKLFVLLLSVMSTMAFVSCSTTSVDVCEEEIAEKKVSVEEEYVKLNNDILELNSNLQKQNTRGFLSRFFKRILNVFVSDVVGAVTGVIKGDDIWQSAQGASISSAKNQGFITAVDGINVAIGNAPIKADLLEDTLVTSYIRPKQEALNDLVLVQNSLPATPNDSIGYYHNLVIYNTLEKNNSVNFWRNVSDEACVLKLNEEIISTIPASCYNDVVVSDETIEFCSFIGEASKECEDYKNLINVTAVKYPELDKTLNLLSSYFEGMENVSTDEQWKQYCMDVIELISKSGLPECDKESLKAGITVGYASSKLWKCEE